MVGALGGRLGAFRDGAEAGSLADAVRRNVFHDSPPSEEKVDFVTRRLERLRQALAETELASLYEGKVPRP